MLKLDVARCADSFHFFGGTPLLTFSSVLMCRMFSVFVTGTVVLPPESAGRSNVDIVFSLATTSPDRRYFFRVPFTWWTVCLLLGGDLTPPPVPDVGRIGDDTFFISSLLLV
jgi:hypothetical protein